MLGLSCRLLYTDCSTGDDDAWPDFHKEFLAQLGNSEVQTLLLHALPARSLVLKLGRALGDRGIIVCFHPPMSEGLDLHLQCLAQFHRVLGSNARRAQTRGKAGLYVDVGEDMLWSW